MIEIGYDASFTGINLRLVKEARKKIELKYKNQAPRAKKLS